MLCRRKHGNKGSFTCPMSMAGPSRTTGKLLKVKDEKTTEYPVQFNTQGSHDLKRVARFQNYRGFLFGSLAADVAPLEDYLGEARVIIDQIVDQAPNGLEVLRGNSSYIYEGNWKMQMENGCDGYHVSTVHWNYAATMGRRKEDGTKARRCERLEQVGGRRVWLRAWPHPALDADHESGSAPRLPASRGDRGARGHRLAPTSSSTRRATCASTRTCS